MKRLKRKKRKEEIVLVRFKPVVILKVINGKYVRVLAKRLIKEVSR